MSKTDLPKMGDTEPKPPIASIWSTYHLMIFLAISLTAGRIVVVTSREGDTAFLSANDRSRWATVASLVERGTYVIDEQIAITNPIHRNRRPWNSIDKVRHLGKDGRQHYYSSKPPLLATVVAGIYWAIYQVTGLTLTQYPQYLPRLILLLFNLPLLALFYYSTIATANRFLSSRNGKTIAAACICFGTMILPFSISLNNHLPACTATAVAMWIYFQSTKSRESFKQNSADENILANAKSDDTSSEELVPPASQESGDRQDRSSWNNLHDPFPFNLALLGGIAATLGAANELPALSMTAMWAILFFIKDRNSWLPFSCGCAIVAIAFFGTNWIAHQSLRPPYAHRGNGEFITELDSAATSPDSELESSILKALRSIDEVDEANTLADQSILITKSDEADRWLVKNGEVQFALVSRNQRWQLYRWDDWYEYPGTYWKEGIRQGVDRGESSKWIYLMNLTVGHHGLFSLTPIWLLIPIGWMIGLTRGTPKQRWFHIAVLTASAVCFLFYLNRPLIDRNYGGVSVCFRWLLWFAPLWLVAISPALDRLERWRIGRITAIALLSLSIFSVATSLQTPWESPWIYRFWVFLGWIEA